ncbi:unnamed protein product, partial [Ectocarpus sp. 4 AP-2014]
GKKKGKGKRHQRIRSSYPACAICKELITTVEDQTSLPCGHVFHRICVHTWLRKFGCDCPSCRKDVA